MRLFVHIFDHFSRLLVLKNKPQDLFYSIHVFYALALLLILLTSLLIRYTFPQKIPPSAVVNTLILFKEVFFHIILFLFLKYIKKSNRFIQASCNFMGLTLIECFLSLILVLFSFSILFICPFLAWLLIVKFYITRFLFCTTLSYSICLFILMSFVANILTMYIFSILSLA